jgi:hypothetical protein
LFLQMANRLQLRRGTGAPGSVFYEGEPIFDKSAKTLYVGDTGATGTGAGSSIASAETFLASLQILSRATAAGAGAINLYEDADNGTNKVQLIAPANLSTDVTLTLPSTDGDAGNVLVTDGSGNLSFQAPAELDFTVAGDTGSDTFTTGQTLTFTGGEGIDTAITDNVVTVSAEIASSTNAGISSFNADDFTVAAGGAVTLNVERVEDIVGAQLVTNGSHTNISVSYDDAGDGAIDLSVPAATTSVLGVASFDSGDFDVAAGAVTLEDTVLKTVTTDSGALTPSGHSLSILGGEGIDVTHAGTTVTVAGEDASDTNKGIASFSSQYFTVSSGNVTIADSSVGVVTAISGTANEVNVSRTNGTVTVGLPDDVTISNDLTVNGNLRVVGTAVTFEVQTVRVEDRLIELGLISGAAPTASTTWDTGVVFNYFATSAKKSGVVWLDNTYMAMIAELTENADTGNADPQVAVTSYAPVVSNGLYVGGITAGDEVINSSKEAVNLIFDGGTYN